MFLVCSSRLASQESKPRGEVRSLVMEEYKVHVGSLSYNTTDEALRFFFEDTLKLDVEDGK